MPTRKPVVLSVGSFAEGAEEHLLELSSTFTVAGTTLADVTGMSVALKAGTTYVFDFGLLITQATATGIVGVSVNYTSTITRIAQGANLSTSATAATNRANVANNTAMVDNAARAVGGPFPTRLFGSITTNGAGTLSLRAQRSAGVTTIIAGSSGQIRQV